MTPQAGQCIKCLLRNGAMVEGIVEDWAQNEVQLRSIDGKNILIITHPSEDIMLIKILLTEKLITESVKKTNYQKQSFDVDQDLEDKFAKLNSSSNPFNDDDNKNLAELKIAMAQQERKIIAEKLKEHSPTIHTAGSVKYGMPKFITKPSSK